MKITKSAIVSNSDIIKNYKTHRLISEELGRVFIFKNNQPDAVLFSISEYERLSELLESIEYLKAAEIAMISECIRKKMWKEPA
jgi:PHD/YefM family antitoxin component YafN of YafNO toxin-antitoxin module